MVCAKGTMPKIVDGQTKNEEGSKCRIETVDLAMKKRAIQTLQVALPDEHKAMTRELFISFYYY